MVQNRALKLRLQKGEGDEIEIDDKDDDSSKGSKKYKSSKDDEKIDYKGKFAMYYARILFFSFLSDSKFKSLQELIIAINDVDENHRIANNLNLGTDVLSLFQEHINPFVLSELDYKIHNINSLSNDTAILPIIRASNAMKKFSRLSDSEIVTPEIVTDKIIDLFPKEAINTSSLLLDIASKQGEFVYAVYKKYGKDVANNFYSITTSKIAFEFTRKVYKLLELNLENIERKYTSYDLISEKMLIENGHIKINNIKMKFNAIVGNPPYQQAISKNLKNKSLSRQIFPDFIKLSVGLNPDYLSLVTPSRWFTGDAQDKSFLRLREFFQENNHIQSIVNIPISDSVFPSVEIAGGINYFLYNPKFSGDIDFTEYYGEDDINTYKRPLFEDGLDIILTSGFSHKIISKVKKGDFRSLTQITKGRNAFGILGKSVNEVSIPSKKKGFYELRCKHEEIRYVETSRITKNRDLSERWKIFISKSNGGAGLLSDKKQVSILGKPFLGYPQSVCTDSLIPIGDFKTKFEAKALMSYIKTKFLRYMVGILKTSQNISQNVYKYVPLQNFTPESDIDWRKSIGEIDQQLYKKYELSKGQIKFIEKKIKAI